MPNSIISDAAKSSLRKKRGFNRKPCYGGDRVGLFYVEEGYNIRGIKVVYDRLNSGFTTSERNDYDWDSILDNASVLIISGITHALGKNLQTICYDGVKAAKSKGVVVIFDVNYRLKLWSFEKAKVIIEPFLSYVDVLVTNEEHAKSIFGIESNAEDNYYLRLKEMSEKLSDSYNIKFNVITVRRTINLNNYEIWASFQIRMNLP